MYLRFFLLLFLVLIFGKAAFNIETPVERTENHLVFQEPVFSATNLSGLKLFNKPGITAKAAIVTDLVSGFNLYELNLNQSWPIASITKLVSAVVAREKIGNTKIVPIDDTAVLTEGVAGGLYSGEAYSSLDLIRVMLLVSSNDAAYALANDFGFGNFVGEMNKKAREIGMQSTSFSEPTGLNLVNQSTVNDLVLLAKYALTKHREIFKITKKQEYRIRDLKFSREHSILNINSLQSNPEFIGGKTGFIEESGGNLLSVFNLQRSDYLIIVLGSEDRFGDTLKLWDWAKNVIKN